jgi:hypothetical protein
VSAYGYHAQHKWTGKARKYQRGVERANTYVDAPPDTKLVRTATIYYNAGGSHMAHRGNLKQRAQYGITKGVKSVVRDGWLSGSYRFNHLEMAQAHRAAMQFHYARYLMTVGTPAQ